MQGNTGGYSFKNGGMGGTKGTGADTQGEGGFGGGGGASYHSWVWQIEVVTVQG